MFVSRVVGTVTRQSLLKTFSFINKLLASPFFIIVNLNKIINLNPPTTMQKHEFAEVIEGSLTGWLAQSWSWDIFPSFGSLVTVESRKRTIFGIVHQVQTGSMDPLRYPFPY